MRYRARLNPPTDLLDCVVGIDPSLTGTGLCQMGVEGQTTTTSFTSQPAVLMADRMKWYSGLTCSIIDWVRARGPRLILIEGYSFASKGRGIIDRAEFGGLLRYQLWHDNESTWTFEVPPTVLKKFVTGKGNANKIQVATMLANRYHVELESDDLYDAYGLALLAAHLMGWRKPTNKVQKDIVNKLKKEFRACST